MVHVMTFVLFLILLADLATKTTRHHYKLKTMLIDTSETFQNINIQPFQ